MAPARRSLLLALLPLALLALAGPGRAASAQWDGVGYATGFLPDPTRYVVFRYDLEAEVWLDPLLLEEPGTRLAVDESGVYVGSSSGVVRLAHDGPGAATLFEGPPGAIVLAGDRLVVQDGNVVRVLDKASGAELDAYDVGRSGPLAFAADAGRLVVGGFRLGTLELAADGTLGGYREFAHGGLFEQPHSVWVLADGARILDGNGRIFAVSDLRYLGSLPVLPFLVVPAPEATVLWGRHAGSNEFLFAFDPADAELGRIERRWQPQGLFVHEGVVFSLDLGAGDPAMATHPLASFAPPEPPHVLAPGSFEFGVDQALVTPDGVVHLLARPLQPSQGTHQLLRWSLRERRHLESHAFPERLAGLAYDDESDALVAVHLDRVITRLAPASGESLVESPLAVAPRLLSVAALGEDLVLCTSNCSETFVLDRAGRFLGAFELPERPDTVFASSVTDLVYFMGRINNSPLMRVRLEQGRPADVVSVPERDWVPAFSLSPDGSRLFDGYRVRDAQTLEEIAFLGTIQPLVSGWIGDQLVTVEFDPGWRLRARRPPYAEPFFDYELLHHVDALLPFEDGLVIVQQQGGLEQRLIARIVPGPDLDGDGVANEEDVFPLDASESADTDGDGVGDAADAFPEDALYHLDGDRDRIPDDLDLFPHRAERAAAHLATDLRFTLRPVGYGYGRASLRVHLFEDGEWRVCDEDDCIEGRWIPRGRTKFELVPPVDFFQGLELDLAAQAESLLGELLGRPIAMQSFDLREDKARFVAKLKRKGRILRIKLKVAHRGTTTDPKRSRIRGRFQIRGEGETLAH